MEANTAYVYKAADRYYCAETKVATFKTSDPTAESFKFAHVSDSQVSGTDSENTGVGSGEAFGKTLSAIVENNNDFIIHGGDVVEWSKYESYWKYMLDSNFEYLSQIPVNAISGNHEAVYRSGSYEIYKHFNNSIPEQDTKLGYYYSFEYGNVKFIMLDTNSRNSDNTLKEDQYNWLISELENNDCLWTIVTMHNPMYSLGKYGMNPSNNAIALALRNQLQGVFAEYGVDIVLQGHDHLVSKTKPIDSDGNPTSATGIIEGGIGYSLDPDGVIYLMNGPAGNQIREPYNPNANVSELQTYYDYGVASMASSWAEFELNGNAMTVTVRYIDDLGEVKNYYTWGILKN